MAANPFRKGLVIGVFVVVASQGLLAAAAVIIWLTVNPGGEPDPTAARREVTGSVTELEPQLCVEVRSKEVQVGQVPEVVCGIAEHGFAVGVEVGDTVVGRIIDVETDPGSGPTWRLWESVTPIER